MYKRMNLYYLQWDLPHFNFTLLSVGNEIIDEPLYRLSFPYELSIEPILCLRDMRFYKKDKSVKITLMDNKGVISEYISKTCQ